MDIAQMITWFFEKSHHFMYKIYKNKQQKVGDFVNIILDLEGSQYVAKKAIENTKFIIWCID